MLEFKLQWHRPKSHQKSKTNLKLREKNPGVTVFVQEVKLDQEAGGLKDGVLKLGKETEFNKKVRIRDVINRISVIFHT